MRYDFRSQISFIRRCVGAARRSIGLSRLAGGEPRSFSCAICGGQSFRFTTVLWPGLVAEWELSPAEAHYIDRQQGETCVRCGGNLRSIVLANALRAAVGTERPLRRLIRSPKMKRLAVLELNEAGSLHTVLAKLPKHVFGAYPAVDMQALPYQYGTFDLVIHSDTLEHIDDPVKALTECRRVLKPGGALCFTVPVVAGRLSRNRRGLPNSYHGAPTTGAEDYVVHTEFGADVWEFVARAGFSRIAVLTLDYPTATAVMAQNGPD